jgi:hypothetical protein
MTALNVFLPHNSGKLLAFYPHLGKLILMIPPRLLPNVDVV